MTYAQGHLSGSSADVAAGIVILRDFDVGHMAAARKDRAEARMVLASTDTVATLLGSRCD